MKNKEIDEIKSELETKITNLEKDKIAINSEKTSLETNLELSKNENKEP